MLKGGRSRRGKDEGVHVREHVRTVGIWEMVR